MISVLTLLLLVLPLTLSFNLDHNFTNDHNTHIDLAKMIDEYLTSLTLLSTSSLIFNYNSNSNHTNTNNTSTSFQTTEDEYLDFINKAIDSLLLIIVKYAEIDKINSNYLKTCQEGIWNLFNLKDQDSLRNAINVIMSSGKTLSELGLEKDCLRAGNLYFKITYSMNFKSRTMYPEDIQVMKLLNQKYFYTDICFISECWNLTNEMYLLEKGETHDFLNEINMYNRSIISVSPLKGKDTPSYVLFTILVWFFAVYLGFKLVMTIIKLCFLSTYDSQYVSDVQKILIRSDETLNANANETRQEMTIESSDMTKKRNAINTVSNSNSNSKPNSNSNSNDNCNVNSDGIGTEKKKDSSQGNDNNLFNSNQKREDSLYEYDQIFKKELYVHRIVRKKLFLYRVFNFFDFFDNFQILLSLKRNYYNDSRLTIFSFIRFVIMFFLTFYHNFSTLIKFPGKDFVNTNFYTSILFGIVKFSSYSSVLWFIIESATFGYKFMSSIKRELILTNDTSVSFVFILKWWCLTIPKVFLFYLLFFIFYSHAEYFKIFFNTTTMFEYYLNTFGDKECKGDILNLLHPFKLSYDDITEEIRDRSSYESIRHFCSCYPFVYYSVNLFYCFIVITLIIYIALKIKSQLVDYFILALWVLNVSMIFNFIESPYEDYIIMHILGSQTTEKKIHLALNYYMIGLWIGFCYFYYYDAISRHSLSQSSQYVPFRFCYHTIIYLDRLKAWMKTALLLVLILICVAFSLTYYFRLMVNDESDNDVLIFGYIYAIDVIDHYDKIIICLCFGISVLVLLVMPDDVAFKHLIFSNLFLSFSRIHTAYFYLVEIVVYFVYSFFILQLRLSYSNLIFISCGLMLITIVCCFIVTIMFELPIRILIKYILALCNNRRKGDENEEKTGIELNQSMRILVDDEEDDDH